MSVPDARPFAGDTTVPPSSASSDEQPNDDIDYRVYGGGGLADKPGKNADNYHTCYALSGLSLAQHTPRWLVRPAVSQQWTVPRGLISLGTPTPVPTTNVVGGAEWDNELADIDPLHNVLHDGLAFALTYFSQIDSSSGAVSQEEAVLLAERAMRDCRVPLLYCPRPATTTSSGVQSCAPAETDDDTAYRHTCAAP